MSIRATKIKPANQVVEVDLHDVRRELKWLPSVSGTGASSFDGLLSAPDYRYQKVDSGTLLHVMNYETLQPYSLAFLRADMVCVQIMLSGAYVRRSAQRLQAIGAACTYITNCPESVSETKAGQTLQGIWIACDRQYFLTRYGVQTDLLPRDYVPLFRSAWGMPTALELPTVAANVVATREILGCRLQEPLRSIYVASKVAEVLCNVVTQVHAMAGLKRPVRAHRWERGIQAIEAAAEIYRRRLNDPPTIDRLAREVGINRNDLNAGFKARFGVTPNVFAHDLRMQQAKVLLDEGRFTISQVADAVGYGSYSSFSVAYLAYYGQPPKKKVVD